MISKKLRLILLTIKNFIIYITFYAIAYRIAAKYKYVVNNSFSENHLIIKHFEQHQFTLCTPTTKKCEYNKSQQNINSERAATHLMS